MDEDYYFGDLPTAAEFRFKKLPQQHYLVEKLIYQAQQNI
jgi:hypothetical protein